MSIKPYYDHAGKCECGCQKTVALGKRFISGHNLKILKRTKEHCKNISISQKAAWATGKRKRARIGSKYKDAHGYILVKIADGAKHWKREHILIVENAIGRKLKSSEVIHHINGIRHDNRPENLLLCNSMREHNKIERTFKGLLAGLITDGIVAFDHGRMRYERES